jgi:hypothetical protein
VGNTGEILPKTARISKLATDRRLARPTPCCQTATLKKLHEEKMNSPQALRLSLAMVIHAKVYLWYAYAITEVSVAIMKYIGRYSQTDHLKNGLVIIASSAF